MLEVPPEPHSASHPSAVSSDPTPCALLGGQGSAIGPEIPAQVEGETSPYSLSLLRYDG